MAVGPFFLIRSKVSPLITQPNKIGHISISFINAEVKYLRTSYNKGFDTYGSLQSCDLGKVFDKGLQYNFSFDLQLSKIENSDANHRGLDPV